MKRIISTLVSLALAVCVVAQANAVGVSPNSGPALAQVRSARIRFVPRVINERNRKLRYEIKVRYPQAIAARDGRIAKMNQAIKELITKQVNDFKKDLERPEGGQGTSGSSFDSGYIVVHSANSIVSLDLPINTYFEGAAHGNHNSLVFNYDLYSGQILTLGDLFKSNSNYGELISDYSIRALTKKLGSDADRDWIRQGAAPTGENYQNWNVSRTGLKVTFDPYQVASYAAGPHEVIVPWSILKNVIDPHGPLARIVRLTSQSPVTSPVPATAINIDPAPYKNLPYDRFGDPRVKSTETSSGVTPGNGFGQGTGAGIGEGFGPGRGTTSGASDPNDYNRVFSPREVTEKARIISRPEPVVSEAAKRNHTTGTVVLRLVLTSQGQVTNIRAVQGLPDGLTESAIAAARQLKFKPATKDGRSVSQYLQIEYNFN